MCSSRRRSFRGRGCCCTLADAMLGPVFGLYLMGLMGWLTGAWGTRAVGMQSREALKSACTEAPGPGHKQYSALALRRLERLAVGAVRGSPGTPSWTNIDVGPQRGADEPVVEPLARVSPPFFS